MSQLSTPPAMPVVASAADTQFTPMALAPANAEIPEPKKPSTGFSLASLGGGLPWARKTLSPTQTSLPTPPETPKAEADPVTAQAKTPTYQQARPVDGPAFDDDHPAELTYVPVETARLMAVPSMAHDRDVAPLAHPEQRNIDYMFDDMDGSARFVLRPSSGYLGLASIQTLTGPAVRSLYASAPKKGPTRVAQAN